MFHGLTWFGIPLEYFLRMSEVLFIISVVVGTATFIVQKMIGR
jgi:hypothetical protein